MLCLTAFELLILVELLLLATAVVTTTTGTTEPTTVSDPEEHNETKRRRRRRNNNNNKSSNSNNPPPNILLLLADDLGYGEVEDYYYYYNGGDRTTPVIQTPRLGRLRREGTMFTDFYSGEAVCAPARCALFTGKHTGHATVRGNRKGPDGYDFPLKADPDDVTIAQLLRDNAGYRTAMVGKWCFGGAGSPSSPWKKGFDDFYGHLQQAAAHNMYPRYLFEKKSPRDEGVRKIWFPENTNATREKCMGTEGEQRCRYSHSLFVDRALEFLEDPQQNNDPFFLYVSFTIPHAGGWTGDWSETGNPVPSDGRYAHYENWPDVEKDHAASVTEYLDRDVGRVLDKLEELGLAENTVVLFTSDNGPHNEGGHDVNFFDSSGPFRGFKRSLYEGGLRVPFLARWPGKILSNATTEEPGWFPDLYDTLAEIAGIQLPENATDGHSLLGVLAPHHSPSPPPPRDRALYWEFCTNGKWGQAVRRGPWKLVSLDRPHRPWELYHLSDDPGEASDVARDHPGLVGELEQEARRAHTDDPNWPTGRSCKPSDSFERSVSFAMDFS